MIEYFFFLTFLNNWYNINKWSNQNKNVNQTPPIHSVLLCNLAHSSIAIVQDSRGARRQTDPLHDSILPDRHVGQASITMGGYCDRLWCRHSDMCDRNSEGIMRQDVDGETGAGSSDCAGY